MKLSIDIDMQCPPPDGRCAIAIESAGDIARDQAYEFLASHLGEPSTIAEMKRRLETFERERDNERREDLARAASRERMTRAATIRAVRVWVEKVGMPQPLPRPYADLFTDDEARELLELGLAVKRPDPPPKAVSIPGLATT